MIALKILDVKTFMDKFLKGIVFYPFSLSSGQILSLTDFKITGTLNKSFYTSEQLDEMNETEYITWQTIQPYVFNIIKGAKTPTLMKFVLILSKYEIEAVLKTMETTYTPNDIQGLFINIRFENQQLSLTTGSSLKTFSLDKQIDLCWDAYIKNFLKANEINFEDIVSTH